MIDNRVSLRHLLRPKLLPGGAVFRIDGTFRDYTFGSVLSREPIYTSIRFQNEHIKMRDWEV